MLILPKIQLPWRCQLSLAGVVQQDPLIDRIDIEIVPLREGVVQFADALADQLHFRGFGLALGEAVADARFDRSLALAQPFAGYDHEVVVAVVLGRLSVRTRPDVVNDIGVFCVTPV